jgi:flagellar basal body rod protein FlgG
MIEGMVNTARSLALQLRMQEVTANNLANANTDAFKATRVAAHSTTQGAFPIPVHALDTRPGAFEPTGRPLDVALEGPGYLVVETDSGERLVRGGSLSLDAHGRLLDPGGDPVLGDRGAIVIAGADVRVAADGVVFADGVAVDQLRIVAPTDPTGLSPEGAGRYVAAGGFAPAPPGSVALRTHGIERPNLDPTLATVDLVSIQRAYAANLDALKTMDGVLGTITAELGKV